MIFTPQKSVLLVIDVQGKLAYSVHEKEALFRHIKTLIGTAKHLEIPIIYTEQVPDKIGDTIPEVKEELKDYQLIVKASFSCCGEPAFNKKLSSLKRQQIIITGIETHVCVQQTALDLIKKKYKVQVVADAVSSRTLENKTIALERIKTHGGLLTSTEAIATELLRTSKHKKFREILSYIK